MESKTKHLEMIQGVINRLSTNSFLLKGWSVVLVSALFALSAGDSNPAFIFLAYIPALVFWGLDGYFLWEERKFRKLYDRVRTLDEPAIDSCLSGYHPHPLYVVCLLGLQARGRRRRIEEAIRLILDCSENRTGV